MRLTLILIASIIAAGGFIATIKVPDTKSSEQILQNYRTSPEATLASIEAAIFKCVPDSSVSGNARRFTGDIIAPFYMEAVALRMEGSSKETFGAQIQKWIITNHPKLLTELPDKDFLELVSYLKIIGNDDVENCILSSATTSRSRDAATKEWQLRLQ